jgi:hypothetical protein
VRLPNGQNAPAGAHGTETAQAAISAARHLGGLLDTREGGSADPLRGKNVMQITEFSAPRAQFSGA